MAIYKLDKICKTVRGNSSFQKKDLKPEKQPGDYVALHYGKTYKVNEVLNDFSFYCNNEFYKENQLVEKNDTIFVSTSETLEDLGHSYIYKRDDNGLLGGEQILLKSNENIVKKEYLYYLTKGLKKQLQMQATGMKVYRFKKEDFKNISVEIPSLEDQQYIIDIIKPIEDSLKNINDQIFNIKNILVNIYNRCTNERRLFVDYIELKYNKYANQEDYLATNAVGEFQIDFTKKQNVLDTRPSRANLTSVKDSIIISKLDGENKIMYIDDNFKYVVSTGFYNFKTKHLDHVIGFLLSEDFKKQKTLLSTGTTMVGLNNDSLNKIIFNKPDSENKQFTLQLNNLINMQVGLIQQRDRMIELLIK